MLCTGKRRIFCSHTSRLAPRDDGTRHSIYTLPQRIHRVERERGLKFNRGDRKCGSVWIATDISVSHWRISITSRGTPSACRKQQNPPHTHTHKRHKARNHKSSFRSAFHRFFSPVGTCLLCTLLLLGWPAAHRLASTGRGISFHSFGPILRSIFPSREGCV